MPQVVAHRGSSHDVAEHTLAAYERAIAEGADALECDVRLTRDGVLVCVHDRRIDRTSNGRGVLSTLELADLADLDFDVRRRERDPLLTAEWEEPDRDRSGVLTLERLLTLVTEADRAVELHIETKHPTRYAGRVERTLADLLATFDIATDCATDGWCAVTVMSFAPIGLRRMHAYAPSVPTVLLMERIPRWLRDGVLPSRVRIAGPSLEVLRRDPAYVARVHARGHRVHVWTVDEPDDIDYVLNLGVDAVITNRPRAVLARMGSSA
ncbi:MAG TPA: glycerophosphodiester phosphodiesterase family protein [Mycobacteriales bacterium]|nr:glycerophosphodiester phosphodiesterase family protein [Mycobacteriales bacterium]